MALTDKLTAIGDAIRAKNGTAEAMTLDQMATAITNLPSGGGNLVIQDMANYRTSVHGTSITFDVSSFIGTDDNKPFVIIVRGSNSSTQLGIGAWHYDGAGTFTFMTANSPGSNFIGSTDVSNFAINAGVITITTSKTVISGMAEITKDYIIYCE